MSAETTTYTVLFPFCGIGGGALGFLSADARLFGREARFKSLGGIDIDPLACEDFEKLTGSPALCADVRELTVHDLRRVFGERAPDVVFSSPPCQGLSALLSTRQSKTPKYQALNHLVVDWIELMLSAWADRPRLVLIENVPRIASRGAGLLKTVRHRLHRAGYVSNGDTHDCGELGGLAQRRRRYLLVARHQDRVPPLLYQPPKKRVRACGEVLRELPMPGDPAGGPMHRMPKISWLNWVRLSLIPAGGDWRDLPGVLEKDQPRRSVFRRHHVGRWDAPTETVAGPGSNGPGAVADPRTPAPKSEPFGNVDRVTPWDAPVGTITHAPAPSSGGGAVADPRVRWFPRAYRVVEWDGPMPAVTGHHGPSGGPSVADPRAREWFRGAYGVLPWDAPAGTVTGNGRPASGTFAVADPRVRTAYDHGYGVLRWDEPSPTVAGGSHPGQGAYSVADPRLVPQAGNENLHWNKYAVVDWKEPAPTVVSASRPGSGAPSVADPRVGCAPRAGVYGVLSWEEAAKTITGAARIDNGAFAVADPRKPPPEPFPIIIAADGTWHRPLTTLELAALQSLPTTVDGKPLVLAGRSQSAWRERIGNLVPPKAAEGIAERMLVTLLTADYQGFVLGDAGGGPVWVRPDLRP